MMLIADSGSTKTDWCIIDKYGDKKVVQTIGINPYHMNSAAIREVLDKELYPFMNPESINELFFYGSGCSTDQKCRTVDTVLRDFFKKASVEVNHDLLGAARALCDHKPGIACILGTGSNSCFFDGKEITKNAVSLGFVLGDEGSGAHLGKQLIVDYFHNNLPPELNALMNEEFRLSLESTLDAIYNQPRPNRFLASFSPFIFKHKEHPYFRELIIKSFDEFFRLSVTRYEEYNSVDVNFLGSIAFFFSDLLHISAEKSGIRIGTISRSAIDGLRLYHSSEN